MTTTPQRFLGSPFGAFAMGETAFFYDEPILFHAEDEATNPWIALKVDEDASERRSLYLLCRLTPEQLAAAKGAADTVVLGVAREAARTEAWVLYESWNDFSCIKARKPSAAEIADYF